MINLLRLYTAIGLIVSITSPNAALAELIIDPDGVGATGVSGGPVQNGIVNLPGPVLDFASQQLIIGFRDMSGPVSGWPAAIPGSVILNAATGTNNVVGLENVGSVIMGNREAGSLVIDGQGVPGRAFVKVFDPVTRPAAGRFSMVGAYSSSLEVVNGGTLSINSGGRGLLSLGGYAGNSVSVAGGGSRIDIAGWLTSGADDLASGPLLPNSIVISDGGVVNAYDNVSNAFQLQLGTVSIGANTRLSVMGEDAALSFGSGGLSLSGSNSAIEVRDGGAIIENLRDPLIDYSAISSINFPAIYLVSEAVQSNASLLIVNGVNSRVSVHDNIQIGDDVGMSGINPATGNNEFFYSAGQGSAVVEDNGLLKTDGTIYVSGNRGVGSTGNLIVRSGGTVQADTIVINAGGVLNGNGGTIIGDVNLNGGLVAPGASPGSMTIDGDFNFFDGVVEFEIGGSNAGEFDVLNVLGNFTAYEGSVFKFILASNFAPTPSTSFSFLNVSGTSNFDLIKPSFIFEGFGNALYSVFTSNGKFALATSDPFADGGPIAPVPLPAPILLLAAAIFGLFSLAKGKRASIA